MSKMSFIDKLNILFNLSKTSKYYVIALVVLLVFGIILSFTSKKNQERNRTIYFIMTVAIATLLIVTYHSSLGNMFKYMMNNFFIVVYFPNIAIYLAAIIAMNIIVWISIFSFKSSKLIRLLNVSIYIIMNYLLALLLGVVNNNKLDIFNQASLYGNNEATALIELSSIIFVVWIIFLIIYKLILLYLKKDYKPTVNKIIVNKNERKLPINYKPEQAPTYVYGKTPHKETIINKEETYDKQFTLEEYRLFSKMLKDYQKNKDTSIIKDTISNIKKSEIIKLDKTPIKEKILEEKEENKEQNKLTELEMLYQKII